MSGLPKSIIRKYGVSKKAWSVYRGSKKSGHRSAIRSVSHMAKRRWTRSRRSFGGGMKNGLMSGFWKPQGMIGNALMGIGASKVVEQFNVPIPYAREIAGGIVGGLPGAGAVYLLNHFSGNVSSAGASGGITYY